MDLSSFAEITRTSLTFPEFHSVKSEIALSDLTE